jgi:hypothetical protein
MISVVIYERQSIMCSAVVSAFMLAALSFYAALLCVFSVLYFCARLNLLCQFHHRCLAVNQRSSTFCLHRRRVTFIDPVFVARSYIRGCSPSKTFSTIREQCFPSTELLHKCYTWGNNRTFVHGHMWTQMHVHMTWFSQKDEWFMMK